MSSVYDFGAVGDGIADDSEACQQWLNTGGGYLDRGTFRIRRSLIIDGHTSVYGAGKASTILFEETPDYLGIAGPPQVSVAIVYGQSETWTGYIRDIHFSFAAPFVGDLHFHVLMSAEFATLQNLLFTELDALGGSTITAYFSGLQIPHTTVLKQNDINVLYNNAVWTEENTGMEFSSNTGISRRWNWTGNRAKGFGDDFIVARGSDFKILDNHGVTDLGRVYTTSVKDGIISRNTLIKRNSRGHSAGIAIGPQIVDDEQGQLTQLRCENIIVSENIIINEDNVYTLLNPILVQGGDNISVIGNHVLDRSLAATSAVRLEHSTFNNVTYLLDDVTFAFNYMDAAHFDFASNGAIHQWHMTVVGNVVNGRGVVGKAYTMTDPIGVVDLTFENNRAYDAVAKAYEFQGIQRVQDVNKV